ncbi:cell differentiation protein rcd1-like [Rutidosis leptorrhynchoides]|uniref:cell differentiation protein rcd1-like n=1 Tax=Rutidosis leptorrhynchoides TaxID=125765 RepID=UPI003A98CF40
MSWFFDWNPETDGLSRDNNMSDALAPELTAVYVPFLSPTFSLEQSRRVFHVLTLIQSIYHFTVFHLWKTYEQVRVAALRVLEAMVKNEDPRAITYLIEIEVMPHLLRCMKTGGMGSKMAATFVLSKMLCKNDGLN